MKIHYIAVATLLMLAAGSASATSCEAVKSQVEAKIKGHGVKTFSLDVVDAADVKDQKVVGSCEGGKKKLVYKKG